LRRALSPTHEAQEQAKSKQPSVSQPSIWVITSPPLLARLTASPHPGQGQQCPWPLVVVVVLLLLVEAVSVVATEPKVVRSPPSNSEITNSTLLLAVAELRGVQWI